MTIFQASGYIASYLYMDYVLYDHDKKLRCSTIAAATPMHINKDYKCAATETRNVTIAI